ncbi:VWA domain-containing protein [Bacillus songklensis]|uniref:VWA domain-containing protein n=1 Tax=Bacillus songklensis TaxID=1069116 RepID=A0ABV8B3D8_9BACI
MRNRWTKKSALMFSILSVALAVGCGKEESATESTNAKENNEAVETVKSQDETNKMDSFYNAPAAPKTYEEVLAYPIGEMAGKQFKASEEEFKSKLDEFPALPEKANKEQVEAAYNKLVQLYKQDYPTPPQYVEQGSTEGSSSQQTQQKQTQLSYNVEIILDASGSMAGKVSGKTKMELAKEAIRDFASSLPQGTKVGLRVYGHKGSNEDKDKALSCQSSELVYSVSTYNEQQLQSALASFQPTGWTPVAKSLEEAGKDLGEFQGEQNKNIIYLVSDGIETCGGNPVEAAKQLRESGIAPVVNVIGFDVDDEGQKQLQKVASASGGTYASVANQDELTKEFEKAKEDASDWYEWARKERDKAFNVKMTNYDSINEYRLTSKDLAYEERMNYNQSLDYLFEMKKITWDQKVALLDFYEPYFNVIEETTYDIYSGLIHKNSDEYFEQTDGISDKVKKNTNQ